MENNFDRVCATACLSVPADNGNHVGVLRPSCVWPSVCAYLSETFAEQRDVMCKVSGVFSYSSSTLDHYLTLSLLSSP